MLTFKGIVQTKLNPFSTSRYVWGHFLIHIMVLEVHGQKEFHQMPIVARANSNVAPVDILAEELALTSPLN